MGISIAAIRSLSSTGTGSKNAPLLFSKDAWICPTTLMAPNLPQKECKSKLNEVFNDFLDVWIWDPPVDFNVGWSSDTGPTLLVHQFTWKRCWSTVCFACWSRPVGNCCISFNWNDARQPKNQRCTQDKFWCHMSGMANYWFDKYSEYFKHNKNWIFIKTFLFEQNLWNKWNCLRLSFVIIVDIHTSVLLKCCETSSDKTKRFHFWDNILFAIFYLLSIMNENCGFGKLVA